MMRAVISLAVAVAFIATACSSDTAPPEPNPTSDEPAAHGTFAECLDSHGVPAPPGPAAGPPPGVDHETWQQAMQSCSSLAPGPAR